MKTAISIALALLLLVITAAPGRASTVLVKNNSTFRVDVKVGSNPNPQPDWNVIRQLFNLPSGQEGQVLDNGKYIKIVLVSFSSGQGWTSSTVRCDIRVDDKADKDVTILLEGNPWRSTFKCTHVK